MSLAAILQSTRDSIREACNTFYTNSIPVINFQDIQCEICENGFPPVPCPHFFIAIHPTEWQPGDIFAEPMMGLDESFSLGVTISWKTAPFPIGRQMGGHYLLTQTKMEQLCRLIMKTVHQSTDIMNTASALNDTVTDRTDLSIYEYLRWGGTTTPTAQGYEWFHEDAPSASQKGMVYGYVSTITFNGARLTQNSQTLALE